MLRKLKVNIDTWGAVCFAIFSVVFFIMSLEYPYKSSIGPGPGFFPLWLSGFLFVLSAIYLIQSLKAASASDEDEQEKKKNEALPYILNVMICMILFGLLLKVLGFITTASIVLLLLLRRAYKWYINLGIAVGASLFLFWLFHSILRVQLPVNGLGF
jgi:putative tricarboxylic transport membrane protein